MQSGVIPPVHPTPMLPLPISPPVLPPAKSVVGSLLGF